MLQIYLLAVLSGLLCWLGWPTIGFFPLLWVGFVPQLIGIKTIMNSELKRKAIHLFFLVFIAHLLWIGLSLKWVHTTSPKTYFIAIFLESFSLAFAMTLLSFFRKRTNNFLIGLFFISAFLFVEYINQNWMAGTPYFVLGNGYGMHPWLIQFYEFSGVEGGTFLTLLINVLIWVSWDSWKEKHSLKRLVLALAICFLPFLISPILNHGISQNDKSIKVGALHTYMETYTETSHKEPSIVVKNLWKQSERSGISDLELLVWPETIISNLGWIHNLSNDKAYQSIEKQIKEYPDLTICAGGYAFSVVAKDKVDAYSVRDEARGFNYTSHNVAVSFNASGRIPARSKAVFIPFQERIPFLDQLPFLRNFADLVGANTMVSFYEHGQEIHKTAKGKKYVPMLCFESIYPLNMAHYSNQADLLLILSNEYWNMDLSGSDQYMYTHVGMAIQSRTPIIRSCNSGISVILDKNGNILAKKKGKDTGLLKAEVNLKSDETFYEKIAGLFYGIGLILYPGLLVFGLFGRFRKS